MKKLYSHTRTDGDYSEEIKVINESNLSNTDHIRFKEIDSDGGEFAEEMIDQIDIAMALEKLPEDIQHVIEMTMDGFTQQEIANKLEISQPAVFKKMQKAKELLHPTQWAMFNLQAA